MQRGREKRRLDLFETFLFDMDGVLTDSMPCHYEAWRRIFEKFGIRVSRQEVLEREGEKGLVTLESLLGRQGLSLRTEQLHAILDEKEEIFRSLASPALFPGALELVEELHAAGKQLALVTGTSATEARANLPDRLLRCFQAVVTGDRVQKGKPDPEPYETALRLLQASRKTALVIENAPYGIRSAKSAGLRCVALATSLPVQYLQEADDIVDDLHELRLFLFGGDLSV